jgi:hypothetical protein
MICILNTDNTNLIVQLLNQLKVRYYKIVLQYSSQLLKISACKDCRLLFVPPLVIVNCLLFTMIVKKKAIFVL